MGLQFRATVVASVLVLLIVRPARAEIDADQVKHAIDRGIDYLKKAQSKDGTWVAPLHDTNSQSDGLAALCTLALLNAGVPVEDESIQRSLTHLRGVTPDKTYTAALQTMVFCTAEPKRDLPKIQQNAQWLIGIQNKTGVQAGAWSYPSGPNGGDNSNTQFAMLALFEAERQGVPIPKQVWKLSRDYWRACQSRQNGSWNYVPGYPGTGSMTCAGITSMIIAGGKMNAPDASIEGDELICCGNQAGDDSVERGLKWLGDNFRVSTNPSEADSDRSTLFALYYLYGMERVGRMTAHRFIGKHDWYREGAEMLIGKQDKLDGSWRGTGNFESEPTIGTPLALLFLAKGRRPVLMAKLQHGQGDDWNHHRSDVANLTAYVETQWKRDLTWQVIDMTGRGNVTADDLIQAPVLFINGSKWPGFTEEQAHVLRDYIDRGGFIFAEACCTDSANFDRGFRKLMEWTFPEAEYKLKLLPPSHPVWNAQEVVPPDGLRPLLGIEYGCRTSVIYAPPVKGDDPPGNLSCWWEIMGGRDLQVPAKFEVPMTSARAIGINVLAYATNRELKTKDSHFGTPAAELPKDDFDRGKLYIANLQHPGGCEAAPMALPNLIKAAGREFQLRVSTEPRLVAISDPQLLNYAFVFMHGRQRFRLTPKERTQLKTFLERGGTVLVDAICANPDFAASFRDEMNAMFPKQLQPIPAEDRLFSKDFGGYDLTSVTRRQPQRKTDGPIDAKVIKGPPTMEGIKLGDRYAVIFSPYDLSCALEKHDSLECAGYSRDDAERISLNALLYALHK